ncbi:MAG: class I SAM-dependent methyltransferase [Vicinamibacterales bacterium]
MLGRIRQALASAPIQFVLWDGFTLSTSSGPPVATVVLNTRSALLACLWNPDLNFGEGYMSGAIEVRGDLLALMEAINRAIGRVKSGHRRRSQRPNDLRTSEHNVHHHYDLGNAFYRLWLDPELVYTCAYFPTAETSLVQAQIAKMDLVCRKLDLRAGDRVVEAGCGWGSLALYMAEHYGVTVRAFNVSTEQIAHARHRARQAGLDQNVEFIEDDYRNVRGPFDVFVSIGMLEHVGPAHYATLGRVIDEGLTQSGCGLLHFIGRNQPAPLNAWIRKRIFPGAYPPTLTEVFAGVFEPRGFSVLDVENLRLHYAKTLDWWRRGFNAHEAEVAAMFDDPFVRAWRLYLAGSQAAFSTGAMQLFQVLFTRSDNNAIPWLRVAGLTSE